MLILPPSCITNQNIASRLFKYTSFEIIVNKYPVFSHYLCLLQAQSLHWSCKDEVVIIPHKVVLSIKRNKINKKFHKVPETQS